MAEVPPGRGTAIASTLPAMAIGIAQIVIIATTAAIAPTVKIATDVEIVLIVRTASTVAIVRMEMD